MSSRDWESSCFICCLLRADSPRSRVSVLCASLPPKDIISLAIVGQLSSQLTATAESCKPKFQIISTPDNNINPGLIDPGWLLVVVSGYRHGTPQIKIPGFINSGVDIRFQLQTRTKASPIPFINPVGKQTITQCVLDLKSIYINAFFPRKCIPWGHMNRFNMNSIKLSVNFPASIHASVLACGEANHSQLNCKPHLPFRHMHRGSQSAVAVSRPCIQGKWNGALLLEKLFPLLAFHCDNLGSP